MTKKISALLAIAGFIMMTGCSNSVPTPQYNAPKSSTASSAITGQTLTVKYNIQRDGKKYTWDPHSYFIYGSNSNKPLATSYNYGNGIPWLHERMGLPGLVFIYGTIGDKVVMTFSNGVGGGNPLAVYDFSEGKTYFLTQGKEKYSFYKKGTSYVVKILDTNKYISLNNLKEVKINESSYSIMPVYLSQFSDHTNLKRQHKHTQMGDLTVIRFVAYRDNFGSLPKFLFGPQPQQVSLGYRP